MNNVHLYAFVAVVEQGSFRAAANFLHKTQSTISAAIVSLEQEFEVQLLSRDAYRPELTPEGKVFYQEARITLEKMQGLEALGHQLASGIGPNLALTLSASCVQLQGLVQLQMFVEKHPEMHLSMSTEHLSGVLESLQSGKADIAISPNYGLGQEFEFVEIAKLKLVTVAAPHYLENQTQRIIPQAELKNRPQVLIEDSGSLHPIERLNVIPNGQRWTVNDYMIKQRLIVSGLAWSRLPYHMVEKELKVGSVEMIEVEDFASNVVLPIYLIRLKSNTSAIANSFWDYMIKEPSNKSSRLSV
ncbi:transcriptional regulator [Marinomonas sp. SBI22]|uniref:LysR family transcriptional regulator n=1 Tax=unclassified Marinomonas TaxID=196814 RepID=UPI0007AF21F1|nr:MULTISPECIES: LysR family transcriptional regulator [unclassified Marinomonas]KZM42053.1 transcriptional regulator [Marinomonas sp. SBI22]KZM47104.1 transcriptional regulator [Marinomonas sp. SBI8L]